MFGHYEMHAVAGHSDVRVKMLVQGYGGARLANRRNRGSCATSM